LEGYSKKHTADSITALGSLYPAEALLLVPRSPSDTARHDFPDDPEKGVINLEDDSASIKSGVKIEKIDVSFLEVGDVVRVQLGASPPSDGTIVSNGESAFDESSLTGESKPVRKQEGDKVFVGTINKSSMVDVRVDAIGGETM
jgi:P-type Cu+ transporter